MNIFLKILRKCSIVFLISPNQEKDGNMSTLFDIWNTIQTKLFPWLEQELDPLSDKEREFVQVVSLLDLPSHMKEFSWRGLGRKKKSRINMAKAFVAKSVYKFETTDIFIEYLRNCKNIRRLCGWELACEIPSSATFSRAFTEFATHSLPQKIHEAMVGRSRYAAVKSLIIVYNSR